MKNVLTILLTAFLFASVGFKANAQAIDMALQILRQVLIPESPIPSVSKL
jgi:hypothetical protein